MEKIDVGIIGGTGVYNTELLENAKKARVHTPYGNPSDLITTGVFNGVNVAILPRHGAMHAIPPHKINFKANIYALKQLGVKRIIATAATGSLKKNYKAGDIVIPHQFIDFSKEVHTFYNEGKFYHVSMADPFCSELRDLLIKATKVLKIKMHDKGTYLKIDGPQFSTRAASNMYKQFADIIGMTCVPEAILARELEICFGVIATVTDYDVWADKPTNFNEIKRVMGENLEKTRKILEEVIPNISEERNCECKEALKNASA